MNDTKKATDIILKSNVLDRADVESTGDVDNLLLAQSGLEKIQVNDREDLTRYNNLITFSVYVKGMRDDNKYGVGKMIGAFIRFDGRIVDEASSGYHGSDDVLREKMINGDVYQVDGKDGIIVPVGFKTAYTFSINISKKHAKKLLIQCFH